MISQKKSFNIIFIDTNRHVYTISQRLVPILFLILFKNNVNDETDAEYADESDEIFILA